MIRTFRRTTERLTAPLGMDVTGEHPGALAVAVRGRWSRRPLDQLRAHSRHPRLVGPLHPRHEVLAHEATQVEQRAGVDGGDQRPHANQATDRVGYLQHLRATVPEVGPLDDPLELVAHPPHVDLPVDVHLDRAEELGAVPGPVLERRAREVRRRQHHPPVVPQPHDHVAQRDLLDPAPLLVRDHHVVDADRVAERELDPGEDVGQRGLGGESRDDADQPGRGEQAGTHGAHAGEAEQSRSEGHHDHDRHGQPPQDQHLRAHPPRGPVVGHVGPVALQAQVLQEQQHGREQPRPCADRREPQHQADGLPPGRVHDVEPHRDRDAVERQD